MKKRNTIRLTEGQLHRVIKESVKRIISENMDEGQGWDFFKSSTRDILNGEYDNDNPDFNSSSYKLDRDNFIKDGSVLGDCNYYDENGYGAQYADGNKPIKKGFMGRLGRRAGVTGAVAALRARQAYNRFRNRN